MPGLVLMILKFKYPGTESQHPSLSRTIMALAGPGNAESGQSRSTDLRIRNSCCFVGINSLLSMGNIWL